jgi:ZIP family zinc transporter
MLLFQAVIIGLVIGLSGTLLGGGLVYLFGGGLKQQSWFLGLSGGIMAAVVIFDLLPEAFGYGGGLIVLTGILLGVGLIDKFEALVDWTPWYGRRKIFPTLKLGLLLGLGIGLHNFPEGMALGTTYIVSREIREWAGLAAVMAAHNIPEGMVMTAALRLGKVKPAKVWLALWLVEMPMAIGGGVGAFLGRISGTMVALSLGFAGGAMLFLVGRDLLPQAQKLSGVFRVASSFGLGFLIGIVLVKFF